MGRAKEVVYVDSEIAGVQRLKGKYLTSSECNQLDIIRKMSDNNALVTDIKNIIYNLNDEEIDQILTRETNEGMILPQGELRPEQTTGVAFLYLAKRALLGDSVGMGKTVQIAGTLNLINEARKLEGRRHRYLAVTESAVVPQFHRELVKFTGEYSDTFSQANSNALRKRLESYEMSEDGIPNIVGPLSLLRSSVFLEYLQSKVDAGEEFPFDTLIIDESAVLGNKKTNTYEGASLIRDNVENVYILNATPFESNLKIFFNQLDFVDPTLLPTKTDFEKRYCKMARGLYQNYSRPTGEYKNQGEFRTLVGYRYLARTRKSTGAYFDPSCTSQLVTVDLTDSQKVMLKNTQMPNIVYDNPSAFNSNIEFTSASTPKAGVLLDALTGKVRYEGGWDTAQSVLVFCWNKETMEGLANFLHENGIATQYMNGDTSAEDRKHLIKGFIDGDYRVLLTNVMKGLNFGNCNHTVAYSTPGNVNYLVQFEGRSTRERDIINKHLMVISTKGKEETRFNTVLRERAQASHDFAGSDYSLIMHLLLKK